MNDSVVSKKRSAYTAGFFKAIIYLSAFLCLCSFGFVGVVYFMDEDSPEHRKVLGVYFFHQGLVRKDQVGSGWSHSDNNGLYSTGDLSKVRVPVVFAELSDIHLTIDFSYITRPDKPNAGQRSLEVLINGEHVTEWLLRKPQSRAENITIPFRVRGPKEEILMTFRSKPGPRAQLSNGAIVLHSVLVYLGK